MFRHIPQHFLILLMMMLSKKHKETDSAHRIIASPCGACKLLRRRCSPSCIFAPHFPPDDPLKFATVHKVFGASNVNKMLQDLPEQQRSDAVSSMVYEANARVRDPVYGCVALIYSLQQQIASLQTQLAVVQAQMVYLMVHQGSDLNSSNPLPLSHLINNNEEYILSMEDAIAMAL